MANTLASIEAGATFVSCTVNGIGERCGITETCLLITNLHFNSILCSGKSQKVLKLAFNVVVIALALKMIFW